MLAGHNRNQREKSDITQLICIATCKLFFYHQVFVQPFNPFDKVSKRKSVHPNKPAACSATEVLNGSERKNILWTEANELETFLRRTLIMAATTNVFQCSFCKVMTMTRLFLDILILSDPEPRCSDVISHSLWLLVQLGLSAKQKLWKGLFNRTNFANGNVS